MNSTRTGSVAYATSTLLLPIRRKFKGRWIPCSRTLGAVNRWATPSIKLLKQGLQQSRLARNIYARSSAF